jgi:hypothetical protein
LREPCDNHTEKYFYIRRCVLITKKAFLGSVLALLMVVLPVISVSAAPALDATPVTCTVATISTSTDSGGVITVNVTCSEGTSYSLSVADAVAAGLVTDNGDGTVTVNDAAVGTVVTIPQTEDPCALPGDTSSGDTTVTSTDTTSGDTSTGGTHPVAAALTEFFCGALGVNYDTVAGWHDDGYGFGVIAQALWMANVLGGDGTLAQQILDAKKSGDYSGIVLPDGTTVNNWGQLRKAVFTGGVKHNLGEIMSGRADPLTTSTEGGASAESIHGHGGGQGHGHHGHGKP